MVQASRALVVQEPDSSAKKDMRTRRRQKDLIFDLLEASKILIEERKNQLIGWHQKNFELKFDRELGGGNLSEEEVATRIRAWFAANPEVDAIFVTYGLNQQGHWVIRMRKW